MSLKEGLEDAVHITGSLSQRLRCRLGVDLGSALCILTGILEILLQESLYHILRSIVLELLYFVLVWGFGLCGLWDLSSLGIKPMLPAVEAWSLTHWTTREVPGGILKSFPFTYEGSCNVSNSESESGREENNPRKPGFQSSL